MNAKRSAREHCTLLLLITVGFECQAQVKNGEMHRKLSTQPHHPVEVTAVCLLLCDCCYKARAPSVPLRDCSPFILSFSSTVPHFHTTASMQAKHHVIILPLPRDFESNLHTDSISGQATNQCKQYTCHLISH